MEKVEIKKGINFHHIYKNVYKTDCSFVTLTIPLIKSNSTKNALLAYVLMRGTEKYPNQYALNRALDDIYGATLSVSFDKVGDNISLRFNMETIANQYALNGENVLMQGINMLIDLVFSTYKENSLLSSDFIELEKKHLLKILKTEKDNKDMYAYRRCVAETFIGDGFGTSLHGYEEDVEKISCEELSEYYDWILENARIDIFFSGNATMDEVKNYILSNDKLMNLSERNNSIILSTNNEENVEKVSEITESMNVVQGKMVLGLISNYQNENYKIIGQVYNAILGGSANSFLFQNVREKNGMAYSIGSNFIKLKKAIFIRCGVEIENFNEVIDLINQQLQYLKEGEFAEEAIENAKIYLMSSLDAIKEEQVSEMFFYLGQDFSNENMSIDEYKAKIESVSKQKIIDFANSLNIKTIYKLQNDM